MSQSIFFGIIEERTCSDGRKTDSTPQEISLDYAEIHSYTKRKKNEMWKAAASVVTAAFFFAVFRI